MKKTFFIILFSLLTIPLFAFPLKKVKKGDIININRLKAVNINGKKFIKDKKRKILFIWRHDKRLSIKSAKKFLIICKERKINCISVEIKNAPIKKIVELIGPPPENIYFSQNPSVYKEWGVFTLPVTVFLDSNDKVIHAIGYEGQYITKVERYLDLLEGKITEKELKKIETANVDYNRSVIPDLKFILKLISDDQKDEAKERLLKLKQRLNLKNLNDFEKINYALVLIKLNSLKDASIVINSVNPYNIKAKFYRAVILYKQKDYNNAFKLFKEIEKIFPEKQMIYYYLGKLYKIKGDYKNASNYFEKALDFTNIAF